MASLTDFLSERIREDEALIDATEEWAPGYTPPGLYTFNSYLVSGVAISAERLTAECAAKRAIVEMLQRFGEERQAGYCCGECPYAALHEALKHLAEPYRNHPDYRKD